MANLLMAVFNPAVYFNRKLLLIILILLLHSCAVKPGANDAYDTLIQAQIDYKQFKMEGAQPDQIKPCITTFSSALKSYELGDYAEAIRYAQSSSKHSKKGIEGILSAKQQKGPPEELVQSLDKLLGEIESQINTHFALEELYDQAIEAMQAKDYKKSQQYVNDANDYLKTHKTLVLNKSLLLYTSNTYKDKYGAFVHLYRDISEDGRLINVIEKLDDQTPVTFIRSKRVSKDRRYIYIATKDGKSQGWIYQDFIRSAK